MHVQREVAEWANFEPTEDTTTRAAIGGWITYPAGIPKWKSYHPQIELTEFEKVHVFLEVNDQGTHKETAGFNRNLGSQILQAAYEAGMQDGVITDNHVTGMMKMRSVSIGEPGGKCRIVTTLQWWGTILLQPLGHIMVETLRTLDECGPGLGRGAEPAWEFLKGIATTLKRDGTGVLGENYWFLSADLENATDHCHPELSAYLLRGYLKGLGSNFENPLLLLAIELLTRPRVCTWSI